MAAAVLTLRGEPASTDEPIENAESTAAELVAELREMLRGPITGLVVIVVSEDNELFDIAHGRRGLYARQAIYATNIVNAKMANDMVGASGG